MKTTNGDVLMTGRSISRPISSNLKPSVSGISTSLITRSNMSLFSLSISRAFFDSIVFVTGISIKHHRSCIPVPRQTDKKQNKQKQRISTMILATKQQLFQFPKAGWIVIHSKDPHSYRKLVNSSIFSAFQLHS